MRHDHSRKDDAGLRLTVRLITYLALGLGLTACSAIRENLTGPSPEARARVIDSQLAAADWTAAKPKTLQEAQYLSSLAPLLMHYRIGDDGRSYFWMADPYNCHCVFYGNQREYTRYQIIQRQDEMTAREERNGADYASTEWRHRACGVPPYMFGSFTSCGLPPHVGVGFGAGPSE